MENRCEAVDVASLLLGRRTGLTPPTPDQTENKAIRQLRRLLKTGLDYRTAERRAKSVTRRREAKAAVWVRMRVKRYRDKAAGYAARREPGDPLTAAVVTLVRLYATLGPVAIGPLAPPIDAIRRALLTPAPRNTK